MTFLAESVLLRPSRENRNLWFRSVRELIVGKLGRVGEKDVEEGL